MKKTAEVFDPAKFGFEVYRVGRVSKIMDGDYLRMRLKKGSNKLKVNLCEDTYRTIFDLFGTDEVCLATNCEGTILIYDNPYHPHLKMSKLSGNCCRRTLSIARSCNEFVDIFGEFTVLPLECSVFDKGKAVILKPNPERIRR